MDNPLLIKFLALQKRELIEHKSAFVYAPAITAVLVLIIVLWATLFLNGSIATPWGNVTEYDKGDLEFLHGTIYVALLTTFLIVFAVAATSYLVQCLYADRKEMSILFWQSMPVSNTQTVLSKVVLVCLTAPIFSSLAYLFLHGSLVLFLLLPKVFSGLSIGLFFGALGDVLQSALSMYLSFVATMLKLFPTIGWFLLFSAFAKRAPLMWAVAVYILILIAEDVVFNTQYLTNWSFSRTSFSQYSVSGLSDFAANITQYDTLVGIVFGGILVAGAVAMRRFVD